MLASRRKANRQDLSRSRKFGAKVPDARLFRCLSTASRIGPPEAGARYPAASSVSFTSRRRDHRVSAGVRRSSRTRRQTRRGAELSFPIPSNEPQRLAAVRALDILYSPPEIAYDEIGELAAQICQCPVAFVSFMDDDRQWFKSRYGLPPGYTECLREVSLCATTICGAELVVAPDLRKDARFNQSQLVTGDPHLQFYCGMPLITEEGYALGTLCVVDFEPRQLAFEKAQSLRRLSRQVLSQLELRRKLIEYHRIWIRRGPRPRPRRPAPRSSSPTSCPRRSPRSSRPAGRFNPDTRLRRRSSSRISRASPS